MSSADITPEVDTKIGGVWSGSPTKLAETLQDIYRVPQKEVDKNQTPLPDNCEVSASNNIDLFGNNSGILKDVTEQVRDIIANSLDKGLISSSFGNFTFSRNQDGGVDIYTPDGKCGVRFDNHGDYRSRLKEIVNIYPPSIWDKT